MVTNGSRGASHQYTAHYARRRVREARRLAHLGDHATLDACRHGGMTELGDAELAEQGAMALSGHKTPEAARLYVKRTERQRLRAAVKRRTWVEASRSAITVEIDGVGESGNAERPTEQVPDIIGTASWDRTRDPQIHKPDDDE